MPFAPIKNRRLYEQVVEQIKTAIFNQELKPNDRLPSERELCKTFGVGRPTIREALRTLSAMGLIEVSSGANGTFVRPVEVTQFIESIAEQLPWILSISKETASDLYKVRQQIERAIALTAAENATEKDFEELEACIKEMESCGEDVYSYWPIACEFHNLLAVTTKNKIFYLIWQIFYQIDCKIYPSVLDKLFPKGPFAVLEGNKILLKAIMSRDPMKIEKACKKHAQGAEYWAGVFT